jgi:uncharacterized circularly permuted ATP-grasp superfamily protein
MATFDDYEIGDFFDEVFATSGHPHACAKLLVETLAGLPEGDLLARQKASEKAMLGMGITFTVYGDERGTDRTIPFDIVPRTIDGQVWDKVEIGLKQRIRAINRFIDDVYHEQRIFKDEAVPPWILNTSKGFLPQCRGIDPPGNVWAHVTGTDLVRDREGVFYVLEDNLRVPSGVSYVLLNRTLMKRNFPEVFHKNCVRPIDSYTSQFLNMLHSLAPADCDSETPCVAVLTPGVFNSAYFEHAFLARRLGATLVEGRDLIYDGKYVCMKTTAGLKRVDVIYRRVDTEFLDPTVFRSDSVMGCPGMMKAYCEGHLTLANAPGTGVADDKVLYAYVPNIIRYYLGEEPLLPNVPTRLCHNPNDLEYTLDNLEKLVVKPANESGGYGMIVGPKATPEQREAFKKKLIANPRNYISQPTLSLSRVPTLVNGQLEGRHVDLRPFILHGRDSIYVLPGGLTRVALPKGSLVVNSSQGGGTKDTWVIDNPRQTETEAAS